jgi:serine/threonine protein kinase
MTTTLACPDETEMLALAMGEPVAAAVTAHLAGCASCRTKLDQLQAEVALLRAHRPEAPVLPSTVRKPESNPDGAQGSGENAGATPSWESHDPEGNPASQSRTDPGNDHDGSRSPEAPLPAAVGKYLVVGRFPQSGQAEVFRVVHPQFHQERVLKLSKEAVGLDGRYGIVEEGKILSELEHPHLVRVYDLDFVGDRPYLVMEYIRGRNLEQIASEDQVAPRRAAALVAKIAGAAAFAHQRGIVHRDIKPKNILVDDAGEPRLIDFGMARLRTAWSDDRKEPDGGTFAFMAPEQARIESPDDRQKVGPRSDVFALGGVLYFLLTGSAPFPGRTWNEAWDRARRCDYDAGALNDRKIPASMRRICLKAMAADPADRYPSADALKKALDRFAMGPKIRALAAGAAGLFLLAGSAYAWIQSRPVVSPTPIPAPVIHRESPASLGGELIVRVWSKEEGGKQGLKIDEPGALPLLPGEKVRLEAHLNQPAYSYLLWLDGQGQISLLYPRDDGRFGSRPSGGLARETVHSPEAMDDGLKMEGPGGLETALLLVRRTPLPPGTDLAKLIGPLRPAPLRSVLEIAKRGFDNGQPVEELHVDRNRGIDAQEIAKIDDPLLQLMERLRTQNQFEVIRYWRFAYRGE